MLEMILQYRQFYLVRIGFIVGAADWVELLGAHPSAAGEHELEVVQALRYRHLVNVFPIKAFLCQINIEKHVNQLIVSIVGKLKNDMTHY